MCAPVVDKIIENIPASVPLIYPPPPPLFIPPVDHFSLSLSGKGKGEDTPPPTSQILWE